MACLCHGASLLSGQSQMIRRGDTAQSGQTGTATCGRPDLPTCTRCQRPMLKERLTAIPYAEFCMPCVASNDGSTPAPLPYLLKVVPWTLCPSSTQQHWSIARPCQLARSQPTNPEAIRVDRAPMESSHAAQAQRYLRGRFNGSLAGPRSWCRVALQPRDSRDCL